ncbi:uncharacterized protein LOC134723137 [Mytilus trossulus]|uniref:uncharacterized protein LOC134723137 n=1 Tax=Mytilus trossulus TaxID=6551 RepID=UPI00300410C5
MDYQDKDARVFAKVKDLEVSAGARVYGDKSEDAELCMLEADAKANVQHSYFGVGAGAEAEAQVFNFKDPKSKTAVRAFGADVKANAGLDLKAFTEKDHYLGAEVKARGTLVEAKGGPFGVHLGAGVSTAAKMENGTLDAKLAGCGLKVGKRIGVAVFDNEFSIETLSIFGKGWLWGDFD